MMMVVKKWRVREKQRGIEGFSYIISSQNICVSKEERKEREVD